MVITARGTDVNLIPHYAVPRRLIQEAIARRRRADRRQCRAEGGAGRLGRAARQGDGAAQRRRDDAVPPAGRRAAARAALGLTGPTLISVGHLIERKGHHRTIEAMRQLPDFDAADRRRGAGARAAGRADRATRPGRRVRLLGPRPHAELPALYGAADALVLASSREGWANVLLEAMACGTPVVASQYLGQSRGGADAGGRADQSRPNTPEAIAAGVRRLFADPARRAATRAYAERFSWDETTAGQLGVVPAGDGAARGDLKI